MTNQPIKNNPLSDPYWRINNLYYIVDKRGKKTLFKLNWAQEELYRNMWYCNVILKARQLGISTFVCLLFLDRCLFNPDQSAGIIAHTLEDAQQMFRRVKIAYDSLPQQLKSVISADNDTSQMLKFSNGSSLRVGTSLRSSTFQYLHISEFGKICAKYPDKAQEIVTGSLNTVESGQYIFIESTAEGRSGYFYDICKHAEQQKKEKKELSKLDFRFNFFPWWKEPSYRIGNTFPITNEMQQYFDHLKSLGIELDNEQKAWYIGKEIMQKEDMRREFPSTPEESWEVSNEGLYYGKYFTIIRAEKRIGFIPYDEELPVHTAWDLGYNDSNAIWFFQIYKKEIRLIDYEEGSGESLSHWLGVLKNKGYVYDKHIAPHDIMVHEYSSGMTRQAAARKMGFNFLPAQKVDIIPGIDAVRAILNRCWFDEKKCDKGIKALDAYKKDWDDRNGCWRSQPLHNWASHGCFTGDTLVLTRYGMRPIMLIEKDEEVLTLSGWVKCNKAKLTKQNASLVAVTFQDGTKVKCTPEHLFLTANGWKCAEFLVPYTEIQSYWMNSLNTLKEDYIESGQRNHILREVAKNFIELLGKVHLVKFLKDVMSTIKMEIQRIIFFKTWNVCPHPSTYPMNAREIQESSIRKLEMQPQNGIGQKKEDYGTNDMLNVQKDGLSGQERKENAFFVRSSLIALFEQMDINRNIALINANPLIIEKIEKLQDREDVYCINVPDISHFSLSNGAIVHNSDAFRTLATGLHYVEPKNTIIQHNPHQYMQSRFG